MNDMMRRLMTLCEGTSDDELRRKGYADGLKGEADFNFLGTGRDERPYWEGFDEAKASLPKQPRKMPRIAVPPNLKGIRRSDLQEAFNRLLEGHATDKVRDTAARGTEEAARAMTEAVRDVLRQLDLWHHQEEVMVYVVRGLPLLTVEII